MENNLVKVTRASVYFGEYKKARKSGYNRWAKVVLQYSAIATNPLTGKTFVRTAVASTVDLWVADTAVDEIVAIAATKGRKMNDINGDGYDVVGDDLPEQYQFAFTEGGAKITGELVVFDNQRIKVDQDGHAVANVKPADSVFVKYWVGDGLEATSLGREYRIKRTLEEWRELGLPKLRLEEPAQEQEQQPAVEKPTTKRGRSRKVQS